MSNFTNQIEVSSISETGLAVHPSIAFVAPKSVYVYYYVQQGQILYFNHLHESFYVSEAQFVEVLKQYEIKKVKINPKGVNEKAMRELVSSVSEPMLIKVFPLHSKRVTRFEPNTAIVTLLKETKGKFSSGFMLHLLVDNLEPALIGESNLLTYLEDKGITTLLVDTRYVEISDVNNLLDTLLDPFEQPSVREKRIGNFWFNRRFSEIDYLTADNLKVFIVGIAYGRVSFFKPNGKEFNLSLGNFYKYLKGNRVCVIHINSDLDIDEVAGLLNIHD